MTSVEQQLIAALVETPVETDCSVSMAVLNGLGLKGKELQAVWLNSHRAAMEGKCWQNFGERWEYTTQLPEPIAVIVPSPSTTGAPSWRTQAKADRPHLVITVKPVRPFTDSK